MGLSMDKISNIYILITFILFGYTFNDVYSRSDNYFSAAIIYLDDVITNFIFYNLIFSIGLLFYKLSIFIFFQQVKENQTIKMVDKLKAKIIDVILFCYILEGQIQMNSFVCIIFIFFSYIIHCMATFRADYLIHTPVSLTLNLNYRLVALFLIIAFCDYQMLSYSLDLLYSQNATHFLFVYYTITISLSTIQPIVKYLIDFYQKYTLCHFNNIQENLALVSLCISIPKLLIQICLAICLAVKFSIFFYLIFTVIELISQLTQTIRAYNRIKKLTETMKNLKKISLEQIQAHHDNTCMVCFQDMTQATLLPCKHFFHDQCLRQWIIKNSNHFCPKCKKQFNFDARTQQKIQATLQRQRIQNQRAAQERIRQERAKRLQKLQKKINKQKIIKQKINQTQKRLNYSNENKEESFERHEQLIQQMKRQNVMKVQSNFSSQKVINDHRKQSIDYHKQNNHESGLISSDIPLQTLLQQRNKFVRVGSLAYGLPTQAVYKRSYKHIWIRDRYQKISEQLVKDFSLRQYEQMMLFAEN